MDFGLSSGEDSESEEDEPPEGFTAAVLEDRAGWAELAHSFSVPPVTIREIHSHFVKRRLKREHVTATKPFEKGYKIYTAGKVQSITTKCTSSYSIIRAAVLPSQKQTGFYQVHIAANTTTGTVLHATCTCIAGKCGACNHVAALMFALDNHNRSASTPSCTSLPSQWNVPRRKTATLTPVKDLLIVKPVLGKSQHSTTKPSPAVDPKVGYVSVAHIKSLQEDLKKNHAGQLLLHHIWPDNVDTQQEQYLQKQLERWKD